ncbi:hypothetical protein [Pseudarthrobacter sulfonivorans]
MLEGLINHQLLGIHHVRDDLGGRWRGISASWASVW